MIREHRRPRGGTGSPASAGSPPGGASVSLDAQGPESSAGTEPDETGATAFPAIPLAGFNRRRLAWILAAVVATWVLFTFARQVGEAADASARADRARATNTSLATELARLQAELTLIQEPRFVSLEARAYGVGARGERGFTLAAGAPSLPPDAPGSASQRIGHRDVRRTPLEAWLTLLFGTPSGG